MEYKKNQWPKEEPKNIIIRMPNWLGDLVMATPLLKDLRSHYPSARITAMCQSNVAPLLEHDSHIDEILSFKRPCGWVHSHQQNILAPLSYGEYDLGILTTNSFSSAWWFYFGNVKNRVGFATNFRSFLLNKALPFPKEREMQHLVKTYKSLLEPCGIRISNTAPQLFVSKAELDNARELLSHYGIEFGKHTVVGINPGAAYGSAKCWLPDRFTAVTNVLLQNPNTFVLYFGDQNGADLVAQICKDMPERVVNLAGKTTLRELMALISCCDAFLTNDSGPMHIAAALNIPLVALFGSTNDTKTGPYLHGTVIHKHTECSPCYKRVCPIDFRCMTRIEVNEVSFELLRLIQKK